jgi:hypothetical protein
MARLGLKLTQSQATFDKLVLNALVDELNSYFTKSVRNVLDPVRQQVRSALRSSNTVSELSSGSKLRGALGIPSGQDVVTPIIEAVANSTIIIPRLIKLSGKNFSGGFSINVQPSNFSNLLGQSFGVVATEKGAQLPWLSWLLTRGSSVIVADFGVRYKPGTGRSGSATMSKGTAPFMIDPIHSGTISNNFVSKALEEDADNIIKIVMRAF